MAKTKSRAAKPVNAEGVARKVALLLSKLDKGERKTAVKVANGILRLAAKMNGAK